MNTSIKSLFLVISVVALAACQQSSDSPQAANPVAEPADYLFTNANVYTANPEQEWAEAVAVKGNKIVYVGDAAGATAFHEVHLNADVSVCEQRDQKGHYARARAGEIAEFTGVSAPYEEPEGCELVIDTGLLDIEQSVVRFLAYVEQHVPLSGI